MIRTAKIIAGDTVFDCLIMDLSAHGARVRFGSTTSVPEQVAIRLPDGTSYDAIRRWVRGEEAGFEFIAETGLSVEARQLALAYYERLVGEDYAPLAALERADFLNDEAVRVASVTVFLALVELQAVLKRRGMPFSGAVPDAISRASTPASTGVLIGTGPLHSIAAGTNSTSATTQPRPAAP